MEGNFKDCAVYHVTVRDRDAKNINDFNKWKEKMSILHLKTSIHIFLVHILLKNFSVVLIVVCF